jgi:hypothetical protein
MNQAPQSWARQFSPLLALVVGMLMAVVILPSALNLPQPNTQTILEYAPVPPDQSNNEPPGSNLAALGLGSSGTVADTTPAGGGGAGGLEGGGALGGPDLTGFGAKPSQFRCVGNPPRQTEDPLSPPCVAFFKGDNGGSTYPGVSAKELRVLVYLDQESFGDGENDPYNMYVDLAAPPDSTPRTSGAPNGPNYAPSGTEVRHVRALRALQRYFNSRYQSYGRTVHFILYFTSLYDNQAHSTLSPETRRADAVKTYNDVHPAVVITYAWRGLEEPYLDQMASKGVINFGSYNGRDAAFFQKYPKLIWGYGPSVEQQARQFTTYICQKVVHNPVSVSGNPTDDKKPRKLGLLYTTNPSVPGLTHFGTLVKSLLGQQCGAQVLTRTFTCEGFAAPQQDCPSADSDAAQNMAYFLQNKVTTIIWAQGFEAEHTRQAANLGYFPEWIVAGDGTLDGYGGDQYQDAREWNHAWVVSSAVQVGTDTQGYCWQAVTEGNPNIASSDASVACGEYPFYEDLRQVFTGIQVTGPRFNPDNLDQGFHAIPSVPSSDPRVPACYYEKNDYTCVKDAEVSWWDSSQTPPGQQTKGCWRMVENGKRYLAGQWPGGNVDAQRNRNTDPCNGFVGVWFL